MRSASSTTCSKTTMCWSGRWPTSPEPLVVSFGLTLQQIIDVDEKNQLLITNVWLNLEWNDVNLRWNASEYGGVQDLRIPPKNIWKPDVLMYNSADEKFDSTYPTNVVLKNNGSCLYVPPGIFKSTCKIDITWFPFDDQECKMKFGSWTYDGWQLDLILPSDEGDASNFIPNGEWTLLGIPGKRNELSYACCPQPYIDITYSVRIRRRTLYYLHNLVLPGILISTMVLLAFTLPPDSGEKLTLGTYFNCIMFMVASSVVSTVLILNYPSPLRQLLANVLDMDDDYRGGLAPGPLTLAANSANYTRLPPGQSVDDLAAPGCLAGCARELQLILRELRTVTDRLRQDDEEAVVTSDWKFAAMVVDRLCLIVFTLFTVVATVAVLLSAPHIIVP
ncbi:Neuronal acetylcholine receptor subunit alpha-7 [Amphibalanus amphitrite]|uniref:Neuronal acetylcholine receptor subunit alpha-7 n=1 Tax=Amphibalanus amphitrite TaxID=1232801 RepID=A0A6A4WEM3_AMPAM|nr:Neuronal acetylcholine receptor subunit alpha-7 [Amphibalanus amphitrite]